MNGQDKCDDEQVLHEWRAQKDKERELQRVRAQEMGRFIPKEKWIPGGVEDFSFLEEESVSKFEFLSGVYRFIHHKRRQVIVTLSEGIVRICVYRLPSNEEEERIIQYMLTLLREGRETDKGTIDELLPRFERYFEFVEFLVDYSKKDEKLSGSETYQLIMASLTARENQKNDDKENSL